MNVEKAVDEIEEAIAIYEECWNHVQHMMNERLKEVPEDQYYGLVKDIATTIFITVSRKNK